MACGTPVLAAEASSLPEAVGDAAVMADPESVDALAGALARLLSDVDLRRDLRARGLARAAQFRWPDTAKRLLGILDIYLRLVPQAFDNSCRVAYSYAETDQRKNNGPGRARRAAPRSRDRP
jgi:hypothetical protein